MSTTSDQTGSLNAALAGSGYTRTVDGYFEMKRPTS